MSVSERYCPACGTHTDEPMCPRDGIATLSAEVLRVDAVDLRAGEVVADRYRVDRVIGRGGFGAVYAATHVGTRQKLALKVLLPDPGATDDGDVRRFYREAEVTASLRHPNTVRVFDVGQTQAGALFLAMEFIEGISLEDELIRRVKASQPFSEVEAIDIGVAILRSLSEAHGRGLVHRDLKPANVMLSEVGGERVIKVLDFGIVKTRDSSLTGNSASIGTPAYMSPEQCLGSDLDGRADLYSLAILLYLMVSHQLPFTEESPLQVMYQQVHGVPPPLTRVARVPVTEAFVSCVMACLAKDREDRPADADAMRELLQSCRPAAVALLEEAGTEGRGLEPAAAADTRLGHEIHTPGVSAATQAVASGGHLTADSVTAADHDTALSSASAMDTLAESGEAGPEELLDAEVTSSVASSAAASSGGARSPWVVAAAVAALLLAGLAAWSVLSRDPGETAGASPEAAAGAVVTAPPAIRPSTPPPPTTAVAADTSPTGRMVPGADAGATDAASTDTPGDAAAVGAGASSPPATGAEAAARRKEAAGAPAPGSPRDARRHEAAQPNDTRAAAHKVRPRRKPSPKSTKEATRDKTPTPDKASAPADRAADKAKPGANDNPSGSSDAPFVPD